MDLKLAKHFQFSRASANFCISYTIMNLSSIFRPVTAKSMSLDSRAKPVDKDPKIINWDFWSG
jgi:hypothetical protein